jgi:adenylate cyclase class 2
MVEIETKIRVDDHANVRSRLAKIGATFIGRYVERNHILDRGDGQLRNAGCGLRVRSMQALEGEPAEATITLKGPREPRALKRREEMQLEIADASAMLKLLVAIGFQTVIEYAKRRERWRLDECHIELDDVPLLGKFVEIEGPDEQCIRQVQERIGLAGEPHIDRSYVSMLAKRCAELERSPIGIEFGAEE